MTSDFKLHFVMDRWNQCSPEYDMERNVYVLDVTPETTVGEVLKWFRERKERGTASFVVEMKPAQE